MSKSVVRSLRSVLYSLSVPVEVKFADAPTLTAYPERLVDAGKEELADAPVSWVTAERDEAVHQAQSQPTPFGRHWRREKACDTRKNSGSCIRTEEHSHFFMHYFYVKTLCDTLSFPPLKEPGSGARFWARVEAADQGPPSMSSKPGDARAFETIEGMIASNLQGFS